MPIQVSFSHTKCFINLLDRMYQQPRKPTVQQIQMREDPMLNKCFLAKYVILQAKAAGKKRNKHFICHGWRRLAHRL